MAVKRGEIYWVEFEPVKGSEQGGLRPALVVQNDIGNRFSPTTVVVAITRTIPPRSYPFIVVIEPGESGLPARSAVDCHTDRDNPTDWSGQSFASTAGCINRESDRSIRS